MAKKPKNTEIIAETNVEIPMSEPVTKEVVVKTNDKYVIYTAMANIAVKDFTLNNVKLVVFEGTATDANDIFNKFLDAIAESANVNKGRALEIVRSSLGTKFMIKNVDLDSCQVLDCA